MMQPFFIHKSESHFLPDFVLSQIINAPVTMIPTVKTAPNMSISIYFKIVFPTFASMIVQTLPAIKTYQFMPVSTLAYRGVIPPRTNPANVSCAKLKKNPASFSRLTLSFSLTSFFASCCSLQLLILDRDFLQSYKIPVCLKRKTYIFLTDRLTSSLEKESSSPFNCEITVSKTVSNAKEF